MKYRDTGRKHKAARYVVREAPGRYRGKREKRLRVRRRILASAGMLTAMAGWFLLAGLWSEEPAADGPVFTSQAAEELETQAKGTEQRQLDAGSDISREEDSAPAVPSEPASDPEPEPVPEPEQPSQNGSGQPAFAAAAEGYFDDALFIGDSRTQGLELYGGINEATYYTAQGLMVNTALVKTVANVDGQQMSIPDALETRRFGKVYIMLGINELGWKSQDRFIEYYGQLIDMVREKQPEAIIYVQSLIPVTKEKSDSSDIFNNTRIALYNQCIQKVLEGRDAVWLDVGAALQGEDGCMPPDSTFDGIHLNQQYCRKWAEFLRENTVEP